MSNPNKGIIAWFARNSVAANLLMLVIAIAGITSIMSIKKQIFPELTINTISVQVPYLGAAPQEVESGIIELLEEAIKDIDGIDKMTSLAREGIGSVTIDVMSNYDVQEVMDEVKMRVDSIANLPDQAEKPTVTRTRISADVVRVSVYGDLSERELKKLAKEVEDELKALPQITKARVVGDRNYEISIEVPEHRLKEYGLTFDQVVAAVRNSSIDLPGGSIKSDNGNILLRTKGQAYRGLEFESIVLLTNPDGTRLLLKDIATVTDGFEETEMFALFDGKPATTVVVAAVGNDNSLRISEQVQEYVERKQSQLPESVKIATWTDVSFYLNGRIDLMTSNMLQGSLLVLLILALFLEFKVAFWVMIGIPVCFLGAFALMPLELFDVSINMISLFAFILVLGIVVDDAIVMGESAYTEIEANGHTIENVVKGVQKVAMPATFGVLTTIAAFIPMLLVSGIMGAIFEAIAYVVIFCLIFSLIESKWILPAHLAHMRVKSREVKASGKISLNLRIRDAVNRVLNHFVHNSYKPFLEKTIQYKYITLASFIGLFILSIGLIGGGMVRFVFFPNIPSDFIQGNLNMLEGSSQKSTERAVTNLIDALDRVDKNYYEKHGFHIVDHSAAVTSSETSGQVLVELIKDGPREIDGIEIVRLWREQLPEMAGVKNVQFNASTGVGSIGDIQFRLKANSLDQLINATNALKEELGTFDGVNDIRDSLSGGNDEIVLDIKPQAEVLGLTLADLARQVRYGFYGAEAQRMQRDGEEVKVMIRYPKEERHSIGNLENMRIRTPTGDEVPFSAVAEYSTQPSFATIRRVDGERSVTVTAAVDKAIAVPSEVVNTITKDFMPTLEDLYPGVNTTLEGASKDEQESYLELAYAALFALFTIYALMAIPLKSYLQPVMIMSVIPFGFIGAVVGHLLLGLSLSVLSIFGIIALAGVVVNDSLIMVDFVNKAREAGSSVKDAAVEAGTRRFRAIVLTSLTTFFGLTPIVLETSLQAKIVVPMAVSLAFGILFATVITLILIPSLYVILDDFSKFMSKLFGRKKTSLPIDTSITS